MSQILVLCTYHSSLLAGQCRQTKLSWTITEVALSVRFFLFLYTCLNLVTALARLDCLNKFSFYCCLLCNLKTEQFLAKWWIPFPYMLQFLKPQYWIAFTAPRFTVQFSWITTEQDRKLAHYPSTKGALSKLCLPAVRYKKQNGLHSRAISSLMSRKKWLLFSFQKTNWSIIFWYLWRLGIAGNQGRNYRSLRKTVFYYLCLCGVHLY